MTAETGRRPGRPRSETIDAAILEATIDELIDRGFSGLSMEAIAARAGVAKTTLYRRWPSIDALALDAMRNLQGVGSQAVTDGSVRDSLLGLLEGMRRAWTNPRFAALMRRTAADGTSNPEAYRDFRNRLVAPQSESMNQALRRAVDEGVIRPGIDLSWVRQLLVAPVLASALTHKERVSPAQMAFTLDTVLAGLAP